MKWPDFRGLRLFRDSFLQRINPGYEWNDPTLGDWDIRSSLLTSSSFSLSYEWNDPTLGDWDQDVVLYSILQQLRYEWNDPTLGDWDIFTSWLDTTLRDTQYEWNDPTLGDWDIDAQSHESPVGGVWMKWPDFRGLRPAWHWVKIVVIIIVWMKWPDFRGLRLFSCCF